MSFAQFILLVIPAPLLCFIIVGGSAVISVATLLIVRLFVPHHRLKQHNDVAGSVFATVGVLYAVLLAFVVVVVWQNFDKSSLNVQKEANCLVDLYRDAGTFSPDFVREIQGLARDYAKAVIDEEWETMERGIPSQRAAGIVKKMWIAHGSYITKNTTEQTFFEESVRKLNELGELRILRIMDANKGVHPILWFVLMIGGVVTMTFVSFFGAENFKAQMVMALLLALLVGLILFTITVMDYPFTGSVAVPSDAFKLALLCMA